MKYEIEITPHQRTFIVEAENLEEAKQKAVSDYEISYDIGDIVQISNVDITKGDGLVAVEKWNCAMCAQKVESHSGKCPNCGIGKYTAEFIPKLLPYTN